MITGISSRVQNPLLEIQASLSEIDSFSNSSLEELFYTMKILIAEDDPVSIAGYL